MLIFATSQTGSSLCLQRPRFRCSRFYTVTGVSSFYSKALQSVNMLRMFSLGQHCILRMRCCVRNTV